MIIIIYSYELRRGYGILFKLFHSRMFEMAKTRIDVVQFLVMRHYVSKE
jgi:hypothetical protein